VSFLVAVVERTDGQGCSIAALPMFVCIGSSLRHPCRSAEWMAWP